MAVEFTKDIIERAFDAMGQMAAERGLVVEIAVYGGSCLILASDIRGTSGDVDAVLAATQSSIALGVTVLRFGRAARSARTGAEA